MFCMMCGACNEESDRFCVACGAPLHDETAPATATAPTVPAAATETEPVTTSETPTTQLPLEVVADLSDAEAAAVVAAPTRPRRHRAALIAVIAAVLTVALVLAGGFLTYRAELWGGKTLPDPASLVAADGEDGKTNKNNKSAKSVVEAKDVTEALKAKGLKTRVVTEFSGEAEGAFLGYKDAAQGQRVKEGSTVTVRESAGPGVPKDTVGQPVEDVTKTIESMGVPVHYKQVVVSEDSDTPEGEVAITYPAPGVGLGKDERDDGIFIGVAAQGQGIPVDVMGQDPEDALTALEEAGYNVTLRPHYSSEQYVGTIMGSYPAPGSTLEDGADVTLYYGIDSSSNLDVLSERYEATGRDAADGLRMVKGDATPMIGMYCKAEVKDSDEDCITLEEGESPFGNSAGGGFMQVKGEEPESPYDALGMTNFSQGADTLLLEPMSFSDPDDLPMKNHLLLKDWGMFELYAGMGLANCGADVQTTSAGEYCDNGVLRQMEYDEFGFDYTQVDNSGWTYRMKDFFVYFPVGSDIDALEDSGYFDSDELDKANGQKAVDTTRPFILRRDSSLYDTTEVTIDDDMWGKNPFVPGNVDGENPLEPMKPAVSDSTVYYLVEQDGDLDWASLPDAEMTDVTTNKE